MYQDMQDTLSRELLYVGDYIGGGTLLMHPVVQLARFLCFLS